MAASEAKRKRTRERETILLAAVRLLNGKGLEIAGPAGAVIYIGSTIENRRDQFWYEHNGVRTYKETPEECVRAVLPHVGFAAFDNAKVWES